MHDETAKWRERGRQAYAAGRWDEAIAAFTAVLNGGESAAGLNDLGAAWRQAGSLQRALDCYQRALSLNPSHADALANLAHLWADACEPERALELRRRVFELSCARGEPAAARDAHATLIFSTLSLAPFAEAAEEMANYRRLHVAPCRPLPALPRVAGSGRMRIGYLSADFCAHTVMGLLAPLFADYDRERFELYAYAAGARRDAVSRQLAQRLHWREIDALDDAAAARLMRADGLDLLVDLSGYGAGQRLGVLALRPAARIATGLGLMAPLGWADFALLESALLSEAAAAQVPETIVRIPANLLYRPEPELALAPRAPGPLVLGCANSLFKLNQAVLSCWARILQRLPGAQLRLKAASFGDPWVLAQLRAKFAALGIDPARIDASGAGHRHELLAWYRGIDLCLDPFPFQGGVTSCEALYMGCPLIALAGEALGTSCALLRAAGLEQGLAASPADYVERAVALGQHISAIGPEARLALGASLRQRVMASRVFDPRAFVEGVESGYERILAIPPRKLS